MENKLIKLSDMFKALGDPTRLKLLKLLLKSDKLCVGVLAHKLEISQPAVSQHLKVLKNVGILQSNRIGYYVHYSIDPIMIDQYKKELDEFFQSEPDNSCIKCPKGVNTDLS